ncbi:MAG: ATP-binding protein [Candidatus Babeliaceae bacterium]|nr:ATP-binding protein [Candidatus Babeliaceae bacterium]
MKLKTLIIIACAGLFLQTASLVNEQSIEDVSQPEIQQLTKEQSISLYLEIQKQCSKQIDLLTAIVQQIMGGMQKGIIRTSDKSALVKKIAAYSSICHQLQAMSVITAEPELLLKITIILKNIIDRLTLALDSDISLIDAPRIEDLLIPDKNFTDSYEYLLKVLIKNDERLTELEKKSTTLGLTSLNKAIRAAEDFFKTYKWYLTSGTVTSGIVSAIVFKQELANYMRDFFEPLSDPKVYNEFFAPAAIMVHVGAALFHKKLGEIGSAIIDQSYMWANREYKKISNTLHDVYSQVKGIKNIKRDGLATALDNVPTLEDESLIGLEDQKRELTIILDYLRDPELYIRSDNEIPKCCLLIGPSRTGKTAVAKAMAATINELYTTMGTSQKIKFIEVNYLMITNIASLKELIGYALDNAPCILFIDEIHLLGLQKTGNKELLNEFLTQLTELHKIKDPLKQVFIIGATNHPELLAPELFKHERFGKVIRFKKPGIGERAQFFASTFEKYGINIQTIDLKSIVLQTRDCDYGHLQQIIKDARFEARALGQGVNQAHLQRAINSIVHGIGSTAELSKQEAEVAAIDQAGKIVAHKKLDIHETIHLATISKVDGRIEEDHLWLSEKKDTEVIPMRYGTIISTSNREEIPFSDANEIEKLCKRYLAGISAQKLMLGAYHIDYSAQDYKAAFELAQKIALKGLPVKALPEEQRNRIFDETEKLLQKFEAEVFVLLQEHNSLIEKLVAELLKERCITGNEIDIIVQ